MKNEKKSPSLLCILGCIAVLAAFAPNGSFSKTASLGLFDGQCDVGSPKNPGFVTYDSGKQEYTISGAGANMWLASDQFHLLWKRLTGDFILTARVAFIGEGVEEHRKAGWIIRTSLDADSPHAVAVVHGNGLTSLQYRRTKAGATEETRCEVQGADVIQLERKGAVYTMSAARFGDPFTTTQISGLDLGDAVYAGLFVCSHNQDVVEKAVFSSVQITVPAKDNFVPYHDYIGSNLELMDVATGHRKVIYRVTDSLQAPNWTRDGKALIYNRNGLLYRFDLSSNTPTIIDTGEAKGNNNDHVLSFNGKMLGISSNHSKEDGGKSIVYVIPAAGGNPRRITATGPSYMHSWSPDDKFLVYTGQRNGEFDIYRISVSGGQEERLTTAKGLDDGPEYTPDGKYIYFNSNRTGNMQIWRMRADGSDQEQITTDEYNNWFPHISPDGKWIVIISFPKDIDPNDHPFYKRVYIRLMAATGGTPKVLAYVYGGQGTINVPSWSPDSKHIAFVSNTGAY